MITGPVFAPLFINNQWIHMTRTVGTFPRLISVPSHFFKVIIGRRRGQTSRAVGAFLVPNVNTVDIKVSLSLLQCCCCYSRPYWLHRLLCPVWWSDWTSWSQ